MIITGGFVVGGDYESIYDEHRNIVICLRKVSHNVNNH